MDRREGEGKIFCTFSSLEAFNEDRLTRSLTKELVAEREKVILIIIIAVCVQSLWLCVFFLRDLVAELSIQYILMPFVFCQVRSVPGENFNRSN